MYKNLLTQRLCNPLHTTMKVEAFVLRLDLVHPVVSGNKWFKLKYYLENARASAAKGLISFGGVYSNHLVALSYACAEQGFHSAAFIRGEDHADNPSLLQMKENGMQLMFVSREEYKHKENLLSRLSVSHPDFMIVPEGGMGADGIRGAADILSTVDSDYTHVICAVGTGTTMAGLISASTPNQQVIGIVSLKVQSEIQNELLDFLTKNCSSRNYKVLFNYHFGGYARKTDELINFMNSFYVREKIPTDFVYTGKMFFAIEDLVASGYFPAGSKILAIHSGGLQGNRSLPEQTLLF